jgi:hypothetical protein
MRVHDLIDCQGRVFAFEVANTIMGRGGVCVIVNRIRGSRLVRDLGSGRGSVKSNSASSMSPDGGLSFVSPMETTRGTGSVHNLQNGASRSIWFETPS